MSDLFTMLDAAYPSDPQTPALDHTMLDRDDDGQWLPASYDLFGRPIKHVVEE